MSIERLFSSQNDRPLLCLEVNPPRGVSLEPIYARLDNRIDGIDFFNVTDCALAKMRFGALPFASLLKQRYGVDPLVNLACRDRNVIALQGDLLAAWATGVRAIVALTGDAMSIGDFPDNKGVFELNSIGLLHMIATLNGGRDLAENALSSAPSFSSGVVVNPNAKNVNAELRRLAKKKEAGARFALSQPVFDPVSSVAFFREAQALDMKIFIGLLPFKSGKSAIALSNIPGIRLSDEILALAQGNPDADLSSYSIEFLLDLARKNRPYVAGFHVISGATPKLALDLTSQLAGLIKGL